MSSEALSSGSDFVEQVGEIANPTMSSRGAEDSVEQSTWEVGRIQPGERRGRRRDEVVSSHEQDRASRSGARLACTAAAPPVTQSHTVSPASLQAALANLVASPPPFSSASTGAPVPPSPLPVPSASLTSTAPSTRPRSRSNSSVRARFSSFKDRLKNRSSGDGDSSSALSFGLLQSRRRSTPSVATLTPVSANGAATPASPPLQPGVTGSSSWRDKGKGKLRQLLVKTPSSTSSSSPAGASGVASPAPIEGPPESISPSRVAIRGRAHSEPLVTVRRRENDEVEELSPSQLEGAVFSTSPSETSSTYLTASPSPLEDVFPSRPFESSAQDEEEVEPEPEENPDRFARLPREVQLMVMRAFVQLKEADWREEVRNNVWVGKRARERWSDGRVSGLKELIRIGRVSKSWRSLSLDGQLWSTAPASSLLGADTFTSEAVGSLFEHAGLFIRTLDAQGLGEKLDWITLYQVIVWTPGTNIGITGLTKIDLTGCTALASATLNFLFAKSPLLIDLKLLGHPHVGETHLITLGANCPHLSKLDVSRCANLQGHALLRLHHPPRNSLFSSESSTDASSKLPRGLTTLRASGLDGLTDDIFICLLDRHEALSTLDLSYTSGTTNDGLKRAATQVPPSAPPNPTCRRIYPSLRHLNLSGCTSTTSTGLGHLAGSFPALSILELSSLGSSLRTAGLARFLSSLPLLRKLDLEDADQIEDDVLRVLVNRPPNSPPSPLTHLLVSSCISLTDSTFSSIVEGCPNLRVFEADGTGISERTAKRFVELAGERVRRAQDEAAEKHEEDEPLVREKHPAVLSVLDNRSVGRHLSRDVDGTKFRPRTGQRGYWTRAVGFYHDDAAEFEQGEGTALAKKGALNESDPKRVVVRSFYSSLAVDAASALRESVGVRKKREAEGKGKGRAVLNSRRASEPGATRRRNDGGGDERCTIS
ncbi:hypothetical protein JCM8547_002266 [Rhodosporidiobolus lusitaniae]